MFLEDVDTNVLFINFVSDSKNVELFHASSFGPIFDDSLYCCALKGSVALVRAGKRFYKVEESMGN